MTRRDKHDIAMEFFYRVEKLSEAMRGDLIKTGTVQFAESQVRRWVIEAVHENGGLSGYSDDDLSRCLEFKWETGGDCHVDLPPEIREAIGLDIPTVRIERVLGYEFN